MRRIAILLTLLLLTGPALAETQAEHDKRTNYDGYGSAHNRYQNMILMKPHDSILKGGKLEYWNGLDEYYYKMNRSNKRHNQRRLKTWRSR
jgi:hypothetical protein